MFTAEQIKAAHAKVKSGADFPAYIAELKHLGVQSYETFVADGHTDFYGKDGYRISGMPKYESMEVADDTNNANFLVALRLHQQGRTDYRTFCAQSAENGVKKWCVDMEAMTCSYFDKVGNLMFSEAIPEA
ncbi:Phage envelope protein [Flavobacterium longum]|uniref:DUF1398 domain-containing protein n=1 Tax=Flavobacterium longum TaxID=1299340 RepID=UPI0039EC3EFD